MSSQRQIILRGADSHNNKSRYNKQFGHEINKESKYLDWAVNGFFYCAVHKVEAYMVKHKNYRGKRVTHEVLLAEVANDPNLKPISSEYHLLHDEARSTRYDPSYSVPKHFMPDIENYINAIVNQVDKYL